MSCCRDTSLKRLDPLCIALEKQGAALAVRVERTARGGVRFLVTHGGLMLDLLDIVKSFSCRGNLSHTASYLQRNLAEFQMLAAPLAGQTTTLGAITRLRV